MGMIFKVQCNDGTMDEGNPSKTPCVNNGGIKPLNVNLSKPFLGKPYNSQLNEIKAQNQIAQQQAILMDKNIIYSGITNKIFGKSSSGFGIDPQRIRVGTYMILGAVVGRYVAKNIKKSTTLGMVIGGLAPLLAYQLSLEYDRRNMLKQEPRQKVAFKLAEA
jgi:hypothetical protein